MAGFRVRLRRDAHRLDAHDVDVAKQAGAGLVAADDRVRVAAEELAFAEAELGDDAVTSASDTLAEVRRYLHDAFRLHRLNHEPLSGATDEARARNLRIVQLCERVVEVLDEQAAALGERVARARRAPATHARVRADIERLRARIPHARDTVERLATRYARAALVQVEANPADAAQLLAFAEHSVRVAERRREAGQREHASVALEASAASVRRAEMLLNAVENFELEALHAESTLTALVERSRRDLAAALAEPRSPAVANGVVALQTALAALPAAGVNTDPIAHLTRLREAHAALNGTLTAARERTTHPIPPVRHVHRAIEQADRQLDAARDAVAGHPGWIGPEALTRLAEAEHIRVDLGHYLGGIAETTTVTVTDTAGRRAQVIAMARRVAHFAGESLLLARRDIAAFQRQGLRPLGGFGRFGGRPTPATARW
jgi:hypothetical protein